MISPAVRNLILVGGLVAGVLALAVVQYHWIGQVSIGEHIRLEVRLKESVEEFRILFDRELRDLSNTFRSPPPGEFGYAAGIEERLELLHSPRLVKAVYLASAADDGAERWRQLADGQFRDMLAPGEWFAAVESCATNSLRFRPRRGRGPPPYIWSFHSAGDRLLLSRSAGQFRRGDPDIGPADDYLVLELDRPYLTETLLRNLMRRAFGSPENTGFQMALIVEGRPILTEPADADPRSFAEPELLAELIPMQPAVESTGRPARPSSGAPRGRHFVAVCEERDAWQLAVRHESGSMAAAASTLRTRNLAVSAGILTLLGLTLVLLFTTTRRAERLAQARVEFAAGVSHEFRTPLAVIRSGADNLAAGTIEDPGKIRHYGEMIRDEARKLSRMVEETLQFASAHSGRKQYELQPVDVGAAVAEAMAVSAPVIEDSGASVETDVPADLPLVKADPDALSQCIRNLLTNAAKYGGSPARIILTATHYSGKRLVEISVLDHGPGVSRQDAAHVFDAFYQARPRDDAKARGVGLGLSIAKRMVEGMGGQIRMDSRPGKGACFTLQLREVRESNA